MLLGIAGVRGMSKTAMAAFGPPRAEQTLCGLAACVNRWPAIAPERCAAIVADGGDCRRERSR